MTFQTFILLYYMRPCYWLGVEVLTCERKYESTVAAAVIAVVVVIVVADTVVVRE